MTFLTRIFCIAAVLLLAACNHLNATYNGDIALAEGNKEKAVEYWKQGAHAGIAASQYRLGLAFKKGNGIAMDYGKAAEWFQKSAEQNNFRALNDLGVLYAKGQGVEQNSAIALKYYYDAAIRGSALAMSNIGNFYRKGRKPLPHSDQRAYFWFSIAIKYGFQKAQGYRDRMHHSLSVRQISSLERRAAQFVVTEPFVEPFLKIKELKNIPRFTG